VILSHEQASLGIDIGTSSVKFVKLRFNKNEAELGGSGIKPLTADLDSVLKEICQEQNVKKANISVCGPSAIIRYANFPKMTQQELRQSLKFEAQKYIPFAVSDVNFDAAILKSDLPDNKMLVLLAAVKKDFLNQRLKYFENSGLSVSGVDIDAIAMVNAFEFNYSGDEFIGSKSVALLNIGASFSNLSILEAGIPRLSRDIQFAGSNFTQKLSEALELDFKSAEALKLHPPKDKAEKVSAALEQVLSGLAAEVRTSFDYYESQSTVSVVKIFLSGGSSAFPGLKDSLANMLGIAVETWDPFKKIAVQEGMAGEKPGALPGQFAVALGLALHL